MTLYLYRTGSNIPLLSIENAASYTAEQVLEWDGTVYGSFAEDCELSSRPDCSETLRAKWRKANPSQEDRVAELEGLVVGLLFGGNIMDGGDGA